eukprot:gene8515-339_t
MFEELGTPEEEKNFVPKDYKEFSKFLFETSIQDSTNLKPETCLICSDIIKCSVRIERKCQCSPYPCEGHICECSSKNPYPCCFDCLSTHLWEKSSAKFMGRFRAKCPFCKSEFCSKDIILIKHKQKNNHKKKDEKYQNIIDKFLKSKETEFLFPKNITSFERRKIHEYAESKNLKHFSEGTEEERRIKIMKQ